MRNFTRIILSLLVLIMPLTMRAQTPKLLKILSNDVDYDTGDGKPEQDFDTTTFTYDSDGNVTMVEDGYTRICYQYDMPNGQI